MKKQHPVSERGDILYEPGSVLHSTPAHPSLAVQGSGLPGTSGPARPHVPVQAGPSSKVSDGILNTSNHVRFTKVPFKPLFSYQAEGGLSRIRLCVPFALYKNKS